MLPLASFASLVLNGSGSLAAAMAIGIFIGQAKPALTGKDEAAIRRGAAVGGVGGLCVVLGVLVLSAILN